MRLTKNSIGRGARVTVAASAVLASPSKRKSLGIATPSKALAPDSRPFITVGLTAARAAQLTRAVNGVRVFSASSIEECEARIATDGLCVVVLVIPGAAHVDLLESYAALVSRYPRCLWISVFEEATSDLSAAHQLAKAGVAETVRADLLSDGHAVRRLLSRLEPGTVACQIVSSLPLELDSTLLELLDSAIQHAHVPLTVSQLARARRIHERTLRKLCEQAGIPSPQWIVGWARCLVVAFYLEDRGRAIKAVAKALGFSSPATMANHLRRYTGKTARTLRAEGALHAVVRAMEGDCSVPTSQGSDRGTSHV